MNFGFDMSDGWKELEIEMKISGTLFNELAPLSFQSSDPQFGIIIQYGKNQKVEFQLPERFLNPLQSKCRNSFRHMSIWPS